MRPGTRSTPSSSRPRNRGSYYCGKPYAGSTQAQRSFAGSKDPKSWTRKKPPSIPPSAAWDWAWEWEEEIAGNNSVPAFTRKTACARVVMQMHRPQRPITCLGDNQFTLPRQRRVLAVVVFLAMQKQHHIRVLLNGARLPQVRKNRPLVYPFVKFAVQLRQQNHRHIETLGQPLHGAAD